MIDGCVEFVIYVGYGYVVDQFWVVVYVVDVYMVGCGISVVNQVGVKGYIVCYVDCCFYVEIGEEVCYYQMCDFVVVQFQFKCCVNESVVYVFLDD